MFICSSSSVQGNPVISKGDPYEGSYPWNPSGLQKQINHVPLLQRMIGTSYKSLQQDRKRKSKSKRVKQWRPRASQVMPWKMPPALGWSSVNISLVDTVLTFLIPCLSTVCFVSSITSIKRTLSIKPLIKNPALQEERVVGRYSLFALTTAF